MTAVAVDITRPQRPATQEELAEEEPAGVVLVEDIETLTAGAAPGCNDDNPYR